MKVYLAGPLFSWAEREFNHHLAWSLRFHGFDVLNPQEFEPRDKDVDISVALFRADVQAIDEADFVLANMDGPDPDSGTAWECGYAYAKGKTVYTYRTDFRSSGDCGAAKFNLMLWCSSHCLMTEQIPEQYGHETRGTDDAPTILSRTLAQIYDGK